MAHCGRIKVVGNFQRFAYDHAGNGHRWHHFYRPIGTNQWLQLKDKSAPLNGKLSYARLEHLEYFLKRFPQAMTELWIGSRAKVLIDESWNGEQAKFPEEILNKFEVYDKGVIKYPV